MKTVAALLVSCVLMTGCGSSGPLRPAQAKEKPTPALSREATVIFIQPGILIPDTADEFRSVKCLPPPASESGGFAPLLVPIVGMAADGLVNAISSMLAKAKDKRTGTWSASLGGAMLLPGIDYCLALSRGIISSSGESETSALNRGLSFEGEPAFVMFANVAVSAARDSASGIELKVTPKLISYAETSARSRGSKKKDVSVLLAFSGTAKAQKDSSRQNLPANSPRGESGGSAQPAADANKKDRKKDDGRNDGEQNAGTDDGNGKSDSTPPPNSLRLDFGHLEIGKVYGATLLLPTVASMGADSGGIFTVSAVVTESEDPSVALTAFASAFESGKDDLSAALKKALGVPQQSSKK